VLASVGLTTVYFRTKGSGEAEVRGFFEHGRFEAATSALSLWLRKQPRSASAHYWKARLAIAMRRPAEAFAGLQVAEALGYDSRQLRVLRAISSALASPSPQAEPLLREAFEQGEPDPLLDEALAKLYLETYDLTRAETALKRWMNDAPDAAKPYLWQAQIDSRRGQRENVLSDYRQALKRDARSAPARLALADELRAAHRNEEAAQEIAIYLAQNTDDPAGQLAAGRIAAEQGRFDDALRHFGKCLAGDPTSAPARREMADLLAREGKLKQSLEQLDEAEALDPFDISIRTSRAWVLARLGQYDKARVEQTRAAQLRAEQQDLLIHKPADAVRFV
jgi:tetratricopeptide (TPR) repeat protein